MTYENLSRLKIKYLTNRRLSKSKVKYLTIDILINQGEIMQVNKVLKVRRLGMEDPKIMLLGVMKS